MVSPPIAGVNGSGFAPDPELYTVAGHVAHAADTVDWFMEGGLGKGWDMDFDALIARDLSGGDHRLAGTRFRQRRNGRGCGP